MLAVLLLVAAVQDTPATAATPVPVVPAKPKKESRICRPIQNTVSRMSAGRECHTAAEWRQIGDGLDSHALDQARSTGGH